MRDRKRAWVKKIKRLINTRDTHTQHDKRPMASLPRRNAETWHGGYKKVRNVVGEETKGWPNTEVKTLSVLLGQWRSPHGMSK
jgi:hypothetical protein